LTRVNELRCSAATSTQALF